MSLKYLLFSVVALGATGCASVPEASVSKSAECAPMPDRTLASVCSIGNPLEDAAAQERWKRLYERERPSRWN